MITISRGINSDLEDYLERRKKSIDFDTENKKKTKKSHNKYNEKSEKDLTNNKEIKNKNNFFKRFLSFFTDEEENEMEENYDKEEIESLKDKNLKQESDEKKDLSDNEKYEDENLEVNEKSKKRKSFFDKIKSWFSEEAEYDEESDEVKEKEELPEDLKEILKIQNKWLSKLPQEELHNFKNSEDYKKYKETLKKYNLIK
ncbi:MAG: hypothetical protein QXM96_01930 [Candidatus Woesearchaeota archaeon]